MLTMKYHFFLPFVTALAVSCSCVRHGNGGEWVAVAIVGGNNAAAQDMVRSALKRHNIVCFMEGSLGYAVMVPRGRSREAKTVLLGVAKQHPRWLLVPE